jgi:hypothetical protein
VDRIVRLGERQRRALSSFAAPIAATSSARFVVSPGRVHPDDARQPPTAYTSGMVMQALMYAARNAMFFDC